MNVKAALIRVIALPAILFSSVVIGTQCNSNNNGKASPLKENKPPLQGKEKPAGLLQK